MIMFDLMRFENLFKKRTGASALEFRLELSESSPQDGL